MADINTYYDGETRSILGKVEIYFNGYEHVPVTVDMSNYLIDYQIVEEASAEDKNPLGAISANELTFTLTNFGNMFSPSNLSGPYYGKINTGVLIIPYVKPDDVGVVDWTQLGAYFVSSWDSKMGSSTAFITCYDTVQDLLLSPIPNLDIKQNLTYIEYLRYVLGMYGCTDADVDNTINGSIKYGYMAYSKTPDFLQALANASMSVITTTRLGAVTVKKLHRGTPVATFADYNQIMSVSVKQSITKTYNGVSLSYVLPQLSEDTIVLSVDNLIVPVGHTTHDMLKYSKPVFSISAITISGLTPCSIEKYTSTNFGITLITNSTARASITSKLAVTGKNIEVVEQELSDNLTNMLEVSNPYVQSPEYASSYKESLTNFVNATIPVIEITVRGNPDILIGDTVEVHSEKYKLDFVGIVQRCTFKYAGSLKCTMTLLNAEVFD